MKKIEGRDNQNSDMKIRYRRERNEGWLGVMYTYEWLEIKKDPHYTHIG